MFPAVRPTRERSHHAPLHPLDRHYATAASAWEKRPSRSRYLPENGPPRSDLMVDNRIARFSVEPPATEAREPERTPGCVSGAGCGGLSSDAAARSAKSNSCPLRNAQFRGAGVAPAKERHLSASELTKSALAYRAVIARARVCVRTGRAGDAPACGHENDRDVGTRSAWRQWRLIDYASAARASITPGGAPRSGGECARRHSIRP